MVLTTTSPLIQTTSFYLVQIGELCYTRYAFPPPQHTQLSPLNYTSTENFKCLPFLKY